MMDLRPKFSKMDSNPIGKQERQVSEFRSCGVAEGACSKILVIYCSLQHQVDL